MKTQISMLQWRSKLQFAKISLICLLILNSTKFELRAQTSLAPVSDGLSLWLKADEGASNNSWLDQSGNNRHALQRGSDPALVQNSINYKPVMNFDGNDFFEFSESNNFFTTSFGEMEVFAVVKGNTPSGSSSRGFPFDLGMNRNAFSHSDHPYEFNAGSNFIRNSHGSNKYLGWNATSKQVLNNKGGDITSVPGPSVDLSEWNILQSYAAHNDWGTGFNGYLAIDSTPSNPVFGYRQNLDARYDNKYQYGIALIGASTSHREGSSAKRHHWVRWGFAGDIAEIIVYNRKLTGEERLKVNSYLSIKYGLPLTQKYVSGNGSELLDPQQEVVYNHNITAIGRDDQLGLQQNIAKSEQKGAIVTIQNEGNEFDDQSFLFWGNNGKHINPLGYFEQEEEARFVLERQWKILKKQTTNDQFTLKFDLKALGLSSRSVTEYKLIKETASGDFEILPIVGAIIGDELSFVGVELQEGTVFTLAIVGERITPGGVIGNDFALWLKAGDGAVGSTYHEATGGYLITRWNDKSGNNRHADRPTNYPTRPKNLVNYNSYVNFDGNDWLQFSNNNFAPNFKAIDVFCVLKDNQLGKGANSGSPYEFGGRHSTQSHFTYGDDVVYTDMGTTDRFGWNPKTKQIKDGKSGVSSVLGPAVDVSEWNILQSYSAPGDWGVGFNGTFAAISKSHTFSLALSSRREHIGGNGYGKGFQGDIAEMIVFSRKLNDEERQKVNTYLAIKYGIAIQSNYLTSNGDTLFDWKNAGAFKYHIAGIARDNVAKLNQVKSRAQKDDLAVEIKSHNEFIKDGSYLLWAHDNGAKEMEIDTAILAEDYHSKLKRTWKVFTSGEMDSVVISIPANQINFNTATYELYKEYLKHTLVVSSSDNFKEVEAEIKLDYIEGNRMVFKPHKFEDGQYFTFAFYNDEPEYLNPAGIDRIPSLWLKADKGVEVEYYSNGNRVMAWDSQSGINSLTDGYATFSENARNYNPVLNFTKLGLNTSYTTTRNLKAGQEVIVVGEWMPWQHVINGKPINNPYALFSFDGQAGLHAEIINYQLQYMDKAEGACHFLSENGALSTLGGGQLDAWQIVDARASNPVVERPFELAAGCGNKLDGHEFKGLISEVIVFDTLLSDIERQKVMSYLSIKYGLSLPYSHLSSNDEVLWDNTNEHSWILGIGLDSIQGLHQPKSSGAGLTVEKIDTKDIDAAYLLVGHSGNVNRVFNNLPESPQITSCTYRLERTWKVAEASNDLGEVTLSFNLSTFNTFKSRNAEDYLLLIDTDSDFSDAVISEITPVLEGNTLSFSGIDFQDGATFTLASFVVNGAASYQDLINGVTVDKNYTNRQNEVIWDIETNAGYHQDIAGIGNDQCPGFVLNKAGAVVSMEQQNFPSDLSFLLWGNDGKDLLERDVLLLPTGLEVRMERTWKVDVTGNPGAVDVFFDIEHIGEKYDLNSVRLITSKQAAFDELSLYTGIKEGNKVHFTNVVFEDEDYFTFLTGLDGNVSVVNNINGAEAGDFMEFVIDFGKPNMTGEPIVFNYSFAGTAEPGVDFDDTYQTILLPANERFVSIQVPVIEDDEFEGEETVEIEVEDPGIEGFSPGKLKASAIIEDNDSTIVFIEESFDGREGMEDIRFKISLKDVNLTGKPIEVVYNLLGTAEAGIDYEITPSTIEIPNGEKTAYIVIPVLTDDLAEEEEEVELVLLNTNSRVKIPKDESSSAKVTIFDAAKTTSIAAVLEQYLVVYPNPGSGKIYLELNSDFVGDMIVEVINLTGEEVRTEVMNKQNYYWEETIDMSGEPSGVYMIKVSGDAEEPIFKKWIKK